MDSSRPDSDAQEFARDLGAIIGELRDRLVVIGGIAYNFWREPRYTKDIDFNVVADPDVIAEIRRRLTAAGYEVTREQAPDARSGPDFLRFVLPGTRRIVEFQTAKTEYQALTIERGVTLDAEQPFPVATPEDMIILKLLANRSKDHSDLVALAMMDGLDWEYITHWAGIWDLTDALATLHTRVADERARIAEIYR